MRDKKEIMLEHIRDLVNGALQDVQEAKQYSLQIEGFSVNFKDVLSELFTLSDEVDEEVEKRL